jgi:hypothetical protein
MVTNVTAMLAIVNNETALLPIWNSSSVTTAGTLKPNGVAGANDVAAAHDRKKAINRRPLHLLGQRPQRTTRLAPAFLAIMPGTPST